MTCSCNKRPYLTRGAAHHAVLELKARGHHTKNERGRLMPYRCAKNVWHIGHATVPSIVFFRTRRRAA